MKSRHSEIYTFLLCFIALGLPNLNVMMSIGTILLFVYWLIYPGLRHGLDALKENRVALMLIVLFALHLLWLFNTSDFQYAFKDLRVKLPLLILPLVIGSIRIGKAQLKLIFLALSIGILVACLGVYYNFFTTQIDPGNFRDLVQGISHIRLSLMMILLVVAIGYYWKELNGYLRLYGAISILNVLVFFNLIQSVTGVLTLITVLMFLLLWWSFRHLSAGRKIGISIGLVFILAAAAYFSVDYYGRYFTSNRDLSTLESHTDRGNPYSHLRDVGIVENGSYTFIYICKPEMVEAWNERSDVKIDSKTAEGKSRIAVLTRYLTSKGLRKDYAGVMSLNDEDLRNIEKGIPSIINAEKSGLALRYHSLMFSFHAYQKTGNAIGLSLFQRLEYWKVAVAIISENPVFGVGTGDVKKEFKEMHGEIHPDWPDRFRLRAHNQFLAFFVAFGIFGFLYFISLFVLAFRWNVNNGLAVSFIALAAISCITEDTLETQAGVTFFAFFFALLAGRLPKD